MTGHTWPGASEREQDYDSATANATRLCTLVAVVRRIALGRRRTWVDSCTGPSATTETR
jgi:hypothetical protein